MVNLGVDGYTETPN